MASHVTSRSVSHALLLLYIVLLSGGASYPHGEKSAPARETELVVVAGEEAVVQCGGSGSAGAAVSVVRVWPALEVLAAGGAVFSSSPRLYLTAPSTLHIRPALPEDAGLYECQLNTEVKHAWRYRLNVLKHAPASAPPPPAAETMQRDVPAPPATGRAPHPAHRPSILLGALCSWLLILHRYRTI